MPGSPAHTAGIKQGDAIVEFDGQEIRAIPEILSKIALDPPQRIRLTILRPDSHGRAPAMRLEIELTTSAAHSPE